MVECRICNREVAGSNLGLGYFAPRSTQPSIPPGSVNEYQLRLGRQRQVWLIPIADERVDVQVKLLKSLENTCHTWALLRWCFTTKRRYIKCRLCTLPECIFGVFLPHAPGPLLRWWHKLHSRSRSNRWSSGLYVSEWDLLACRLELAVSFYSPGDATARVLASVSVLAIYYVTPAARTTTGMQVASISWPPTFTVYICIRSACREINWTSWFDAHAVR